MASPEAEIIDLTVTPPPEVIDLETLSEGEAVVVEQSASQSSGKTKRPRRKKGRAAMVVERESTKSKETSTEGVSNGIGKQGQVEAREKAWNSRSLLDRLQDSGGADKASAGGSTETTASAESARAGKEKKRKHKSQSPQRATEQSGGGQRSRSPDRRKRGKGASRSAANIGDSSLFFIDVKPADTPTPGKAVVAPSTSSQKSSEQPPLLLPQHVSLFDEGGVDLVGILPPSNAASDEDDYIEYLDYDDDRKVPGMRRYFDAPADDAKVTKSTKVVCKNCGAEGEHKTYECPVLICLTCGARDEHSTRSCPISKTCFTCGMKGHINKTCPNQRSGRGGVSHYDDCDRCGSHMHRTNECATLWRMYEYVDDAERQKILLDREDKRLLNFGMGGEGYIGTDEWCYNCGGCGHLGDDCRVFPHAPDFPREPSAFSSYNTLSGPFYDAADRSQSRSSKKRAPRDWEVASAFSDGYGFNAPMDVGKRGRRKERAQMEKRARELEEVEDPDDWFGSARARGPARRGDDRRDLTRDSRGGRKIEIDISRSNASRNYDRPSLGNGDRNGRSRAPYDDLPGPSRETDSIQIRGAAARQYDDRYDRRGEWRDYSRGRDRGGWDRRDDRGPRYRGGYSR